MPKKETTSDGAVKIDRRRENTKIKVTDRDRPVMSAQLEAQVESTIAMYVGRLQWKDWGLAALRSAGATVLFEGPPGTGKTMIAEYLSNKIGRGLVRMNMKDVGGKAPGDTERGIASTFERAKLKGYATLFLDECDTLLVARDRIGSDSFYMVGVINELLQQISIYKGFIALATNRADYLDPALKRRLLARIHIPRPEQPERLRLWQQKIPRQFPMQPTMIQFQKLSEINLTGAEIENAIVLEASNAIMENRTPTFATLQNAAVSFSS